MKMLIGFIIYCILPILSADEETTQVQFNSKQDNSNGQKDLLVPFSGPDGYSERFHFSPPINEQKNGSRRSISGRRKPSRIHAKHKKNRSHKKHKKSYKKSGKLLSPETVEDSLPDIKYHRNPYIHRRKKHKAKTISPQSRSKRKNRKYSIDEEVSVVDDMFSEDSKQYHKQRIMKEFSSKEIPEGSDYKSPDYVLDNDKNKTTKGQNYVIQENDDDHSYSNSKEYNVPESYETDYSSYSHKYKKPKSTRNAKKSKYGRVKEKKRKGGDKYLKDSRPSVPVEETKIIVIRKGKPDGSPKKIDGRVRYLMDNFEKLDKLKKIKTLYSDSVKKVLSDGKTEIKTMDGKNRDNMYYLLPSGKSLGRNEKKPPQTSAPQKSIPQTENNKEDNCDCCPFLCCPSKCGCCGNGCCPQCCFCNCCQGNKPQMTPPFSKPNCCCCNCPCCCRC